MEDKTFSLVVIAHDIRSAHNVGAIFRTASGVGVEKIYLTGYTLNPAKSGKLYLSKAEKELAKVALGAEDTVLYEKREDVKECIAYLREHDYTIIGLEQNESAVDYRSKPPHQKVALLIGTEVEGVPEELQKLCDVLYEIPMHGAKNSLNVSVATGIALYALRDSLETR